MFNFLNKLKVSEIWYVEYPLKIVT
jgi:hypothetical protein